MELDAGEDLPCPITHLRAIDVGVFEGVEYELDHAGYLTGERGPYVATFGQLLGVAADQSISRLRLEGLTSEQASALLADPVYWRVAQLAAREGWLSLNGEPFIVEHHGLSRYDPDPRPRRLRRLLGVTAVKVPACSRAGKVVHAGVAASTNAHSVEISFISSTSRALASSSSSVQIT